MTKQELEAKKLYSINKLSELTGADRRTLNKRLADEPPTYVKGKTKYYELNAVIERLEDASGDGSDKTQLECQKLISQIRNIDLRNDELARRLLPASEVSRKWLSHISKAKGTLLKVEELAPVLVGLDVLQIKEHLKKASLDVIQELNDCPIDE